MTCIDDLFDWLLEEVFTRLPRHDRLVCKAVCKRWYNILMDSVYFRDDRHIYLLKWKIKGDTDPINILMQAKKPYEKYTIDGFHSTKLLFFDRVCASITELIIKGHDAYYFIIDTMPSLKFLTFETSLDVVFIFFSSTKRSNQNFIIRNLERLHLMTMQVTIRDVSVLQMIKVIKECLPQYCKIIFSEAWVTKNNNMEDFFQIMEVASFKKLTIETEGMSQEEMKKFLQVNNFDCEKVNLYAEKQLPYSYLEALQNKHQNLKAISLSCPNLPTSDIVLPKLTALSLEVRDPVTTMNALGQLTNLKKLRILFVNNNECGFGHEALNMPKLKTLTMHLNTLCCTECLNAFSNSFENLVTIDIRTFHQIHLNEFRTLIAKWKNLETLDVDGVVSQEDDLNACFESKNFLRSLGISRIKNLKKETLEMMSMAFPNLEELSFEEDTDHNISFLDVITAIVPAFTKLNLFKYKFSQLGHNIPNPDEFKKVFDHLERNGIPLKDKEHIQAYVNTYKRIEIKFPFDRHEMV